MDSLGKLFTNYKSFSVPAFSLATLSFWRGAGGEVGLGGKLFKI